MQTLHLIASPDKPMVTTHFRIAHIDHPSWYWTGSIWGLKPDARLYTAREREYETVPDRGVWEVVCAEPDASTCKPLDRAVVALTITRYLWTQYCREEGLKVVPRLEDVPAEESKRFIDAGWFVTNLTLSPERFETALMALADTFCRDGEDDRLSILDASPRTQRHYYELAVAGFFALQDNLKDEPADWHYRDQLARTLDAVKPKPQPERNSQVHPTLRSVINGFSAPKGGRS